MKIHILNTALEDLNSGREFYEMQAEGLGDYFLNSLFSEIDSLQIYAGIHIKVFGCHRALSSRFPYAIYYKVEQQMVFVWRVLDCRQAPGKTISSL